MKTQTYIDQSPNELRLNLFYHEIDKTPLNIIKEKSIRIKHSSIKFKLSIIGASHIIELIDTSNNDKVIFTEVFSCLTFNESNEVDLNLKEINRIKKETDKLKYHSAIYAQDIEFVKNKIRRIKEDSVLDFIFPSQESPQDARTSLTFSANSRRILIETQHVYPNHNKVVFTHTEFKLKGEHFE